jgi:PAT family acetyl-CoA transporter-like MFS transporter 1
VEQSDDDDKLNKLGLQGGICGDLRGDYGNVALLLLLYTLQGVPMGLAAAVPLMLQERGARYTQQSLFSLVSWPFSLKILWAPLVDSYYNKRIGRRRSWLLPAQIITAILMIASSESVDYYLGDIPPSLVQGPVQGPVVGAGDLRSAALRPPAVAELTLLFFVLYVLMATQDIAVDGWALTILHRRNIGRYTNSMIFLSYL